jgi:hypothetical protein
MLACSLAGILHECVAPKSGTFNKRQSHMTLFWHLVFLLSWFFMWVVRVTLWSLYLSDKADITHSVRSCSALQTGFKCDGKEKIPCPCHELNASQPAHSSRIELCLFVFFIPPVAAVYTLFFLNSLMLDAGCDKKKTRTAQGFKHSVRFVLNSAFVIFRTPSCRRLMFLGFSHCWHRASSSY